MTTTEIDLIKETLYDKIADIENVNILRAIQTIVESIEKRSDDFVTSKQDFNSYIREWVKNM
ncbi:hypothetical protein [Tenacibaculum sp. SG-28]|uniref:hypothetical protein n=1 Tax=Tenacibaculum sp. SG-28 TaxID=754426 RepID=UPI000CF4A16C|nr:hypothetical protein [Tenacibaculum sp. SG-28]PQJ21631.1 hypothetical protein BSU00_05905 [Tenacibaculum sp. SG-28]